MAITTNQLLIPKKILEAETEKELEFDSSLPEYCPDIARIVKVDCTPFAEGCEISEGKAIVSGKAVCDILYETDYKSRLRCCSFTAEFSHSLPLPRTEASGITADCNVSCDKIAVKLLSPRRLIIKAHLAAKFEISGETAVNAVSVEEAPDTFFLKKSLSFESAPAQLTGTYRFGEAFALNQAESSINEIVCGNVSLAEPQISLSEGRAEIKTSATVRALCEEEDREGSYYTAVKTLPISVDFENPALSPEAHVAVKLTPFDCEYTQEPDQYGENRVIKAAFSVDARLKVSEKTEITVADDLFERSYESTPAVATVSLPRLIYRADKSFSAEGKLEPAEPKAEVILDSQAKNLFCTAEKSDKGIIIKGSFGVTVLYKGENGIYSCDRVLPYEQLVSADIPNTHCEIACEVYPIELSVALYSDSSLSARVIAGARITVSEETEEQLISEITKRTELQALERNSALTYFFPERGETLWSIAKHYRVDPEKISQANPNRFGDKGTLQENGKPILIKA